MPLYPIVPGSALPTVGAQFTQWDSQQISTKCLLCAGTVAVSGVKMTNALMEIIVKEEDKHIYHSSIEQISNEVMKKYFELSLTHSKYCILAAVV